MEIVRYAPSLTLEPRLEFEPGKRYLVHQIKFSETMGTLFEIVGFTVGDSNRYYVFEANHFRTPDMKQADLVRAKVNTNAFAEYGTSILKLADLKLVNGIECVYCVDEKKRLHLSLFPYSEFEHP